MTTRVLVLFALASCSSADPLCDTDCKKKYGNYSAELTPEIIKTCDQACAVFPTFVGCDRAFEMSAAYRRDKQCEEYCAQSLIDGVPWFDTDCVLDPPVRCRYGSFTGVNGTTCSTTIPPNAPALADDWECSRFIEDCSRRVDAGIQ